MIGNNDNANNNSQDDIHIRTSSGILRFAINWDELYPAWESYVGDFYFNTEHFQ